MLGKGQMVGVEDKRVARNSGLLVVGLGNSSVYDIELATCLDGALALGCLNRNMAIYDMCPFRVKTEFLQDLVRIRLHPENL